VRKKSVSIPTFAPCAIDLVTRAETRHILGDVSDATLYRGVASGRYPAPIKIGPNTSRWNRAKLEACIEQLEADGPVSATANFASPHPSYGWDAGKDQGQTRFERPCAGRTGRSRLGGRS
jgi:predicted DNA-binding transcriptional regulator AlpA